MEAASDAASTPATPRTLPPSQVSHRLDSLRVWHVFDSLSLFLVFFTNNMAGSDSSHNGCYTRCLTASGI